jgi:hypothetical protein
MPDSIRESQRLRLTIAEAIRDCSSVVVPLIVCCSLDEISPANKVPPARDNAVAVAGQTFGARQVASCWPLATLRATAPVHTKEIRHARIFIKISLLVFRSIPLRQTICFKLLRLSPAFIRR